MTRSRRGFALLAVLWVMVGMTALGLVIALTARRAVAAAENRKNLTRAAWTAEGCLAGARVVIDGALDDGANDGAAGPAWSALDRVVAASPLLASSACDLSLRAAGSRLDVNDASREMLLALCLALRIPESRADSLVDALLDWRDGDDLPRPSGAERAWYEAHARHLPRNGPLADPRELLLVRGFEEIPALDSLLDVEPGRIELDRAPLPVIAALPGFGYEAVSRVAELRMRGAPVGDLLAVGGRLSPEARAALLARYPELVRLTTMQSDAWIVTSRARAGTLAVTAVLEVRLVRAGTRAAIVRRRTWVE